MPQPKRQSSSRSRSSGAGGSKSGGTGRSKSSGGSSGSKSSGSKSSGSKSSGSKSSGSRSSGSKSTAQRASAARRTAQQRKAAASRRGGSGSSARTAKSSGSGSGSSGRSASGGGSSARAGAGQAEELRASLQAAADALAQGVVITRERIQEVLDDAVGRGRMTRGDANAVAQDLLRRGRRQTDELRRQADAMRADLEQLLGRAGGDLQKRATGARRRASRAPAADRALREVDRARRVAGLGKFPILNYEDLTAAQITDRLGDLSPAELRKVRDHERRNANRKSVLSAIEKALG